MKNFLLIFLPGIALFSTCTYDREADLHPDLLANCDTSNITFNSKIIYVLSNNCFTCHSHFVADLWGDGIHLETYKDVTSRISQISDAIHHSGGVIPMPKNRDKLDACSLRQFEIWIKNGMPEN